MRDYIKRFLIAGIMALCVTLLFLGGKHSQANTAIGDMTSSWVWPADGMITDMFGSRKGHHKGIDIAAPLGTPIYAVDKGTVIKSYYSDSYGHVVFIRHENNIETVYAHMQTRLVAEGEVVQANQQLGEMGNTGDSSGVHLHFEVHLNEWTVDKRNAVDPKEALGDVVIGQHVTTAPKQETSLEALAKSRLYENIDDLYSDSEQPQQEVPANDQAVTHTVVNGETLWSISTKYSKTVDDIMKLNQLQSNKIFPLQVLKIQ